MKEKAKLPKKVEADLTKLVSNLLDAILFMDEPGKKATFHIDDGKKEFLIERKK